MSFTATTIIELQARLRLACESISAITGAEVKPEDVSLDGLLPAERARLVHAAVGDFWHLIEAEESIHALAIRRAVILVDDARQAQR